MNDLSLRVCVCVCMRVLADCHCRDDGTQGIRIIVLVRRSAVHCPSRLESYQCESSHSLPAQQK